MPTSTTTTMPREITKAAEDARRRHHTEAKANAKFFKGEMEYWEGIARALDPKSAPMARRQPNGTSTTRTRARGRSTTPRLDETMVLGAIIDGKTSSTAIARALRSTPTTVLRWLKKLEQAGKVGREGTGANVRWFPIGIQQHL